MTRNDAERIVASYNDLVRTAVKFVNEKGPPWGYVPNEEWVRLSFDGENAVVVGASADVDYDCPYIKTDESRFPAYLLFVSEEERRIWKEKEDKKYQEEAEARLRASREEVEARERAEFERLRAKYGQ